MNVTQTHTATPWRRGVRDQDGYIFDGPDLATATLICEVQGTSQKRAILMEQIVREHNAHAAMRGALQMAKVAIDDPARPYDAVLDQALAQIEAALAAGK